MRTFIAIELSPSVHTRLRALQHHLADALKQANASEIVRWTPAENIHLTLRFLGEAGEMQRQQLVVGLAEIADAHIGFDLTLAGIGCFPNFRRPNVVWSGVVGEVNRLEALQRPVEELAQAAGFVADDRPFAPHLTIGRMRKDATGAALGRAGAALKGLADELTSSRWSAPLNVRSIALIHSDLRPSGPHYTALGRFDLADKDN